jgi:hypothetical protein
VDLEERETQCLVVVGGKFPDREIEESFSWKEERSCERTCLPLMASSKRHRGGEL